MTVGVSRLSLYIAVGIFFSLVNKNIVCSAEDAVMLQMKTPVICRLPMEAIVGPIQLLLLQRCPRHVEGDESDHCAFLLLPPLVVV